MWYNLLNMNITRPQIRETEYLVVGAGAAGCTFGFLMKQSGADVLLLEMQNAQQRFKLCAGILENRAESAFRDIFGKTIEEAGLAPMHLENMCVWNGNYEFKRAMPGWSSQTNVTGEPERQQNSLGDAFRGYLRAGGKALAKKVILEALGYDATGGISFRALPRKRFDDYIRDRYLEEGGEILYHTKVLSVKESEGLAECMDFCTRERFSVRFRYIVGADGAVSSVRHLVTGRRPRVYLALEAAVPLVHRDAIGSLLKGTQGYCWYIPRGEDATVGCGYHNLCDNIYETCRQRLAAFCADAGVPVPPRFYGAFIPEGDDVLLRDGTRAYFLGDAAGLNDAFSGGGIHYALLSAQALAAAFAGNVTYEEAMQPHVNFVKKNSKNVKQYYDIACSVISGLGKKR
jgi:flavin-dependent dehydrogenase